MIGAPNLILPDWNKPFILMTDASLVGAGAMMIRIAYILCGQRKRTSGHRIGNQEIVTISIWQKVYS